MRASRVAIIAWVRHAERTMGRRGARWCGTRRGFFTDFYCVFFTVYRFRRRPRARDKPRPAFRDRRNFVGTDGGSRKKKKKPSANGNREKKTRWTPNGATTPGFGLGHGRIILHMIACTLFKSELTRVGHGTIKNCVASVYVRATVDCREIKQTRIRISQTILDPYS